MPYLSVDEAIETIRQAGWKVEGSIDNQMDLIFDKPYSRLRIKAEIRQDANGTCSTTYTWFLGPMPVTKSYTSGSRHSAIDDFFRKIDSYAAAYIDGLTNIPRILEVHKKYTTMAEEEQELEDLFAAIAAKGI